MLDLFTIKTSASITNTHSNYASVETTYVGSTLLGDNIKINSGGDTQIKGSTISAKEDVSMESKGTTTIEAGENSFTSAKDYTSKTHSLDVSVGVGVVTILTGGTASVNATYSYNQTKGNDYTTAKTYTGSIISGGNNVNLSATKDINLIGSNVYGNNVSTSAENLNITSLQNEYHSWGESTTFGMSIGVGLEAGGSGSIGFNYGESKYDSYNLITENVAGISAKNDLNIDVTNNVNLKGAILEGGNKVDLKANNLNIEDLKDISESTSSSWGVGYTFSFGGSKEDQASEFIKGGELLGTGLKELAQTINSINGNGLSFNVDMGKSKSSTITAVKGGISNLDNINVNNLNLNGYDYGTNLSNIHTDTQNNREVISSNTEGYNISIAPGKWLSSASGALSAISTYGDLTPKGVYYYFENNWGRGKGTGFDFKKNEECITCEEGWTLGEPVTGISSKTKTKNQDGVWVDKENNKLSWLELQMYDDSPFMIGVNKNWPGAQAWSQMHDDYLEPEKNQYMPYGNHTQLTIIPFGFLGLYGGIYGYFHKKNINKEEGK